MRKGYSESWALLPLTFNHLLLTKLSSITPVFQNRSYGIFIFFHRFPSFRTRTCNRIVENFPLKSQNNFLSYTAMDIFVFWLIIISMLCFCLERFFPWRKQKIFRKQFKQDLFWLVFNGYIFSLLINHPSTWMVTSLNLLFNRFTLPAPETWNLLRFQPLWLQFFVFLILQDFLEWCIHNLLHRNPLLWRFHRLHHSIEIMDWIGNMRFHWMEIIIYKSLKYVPLIMLGVDLRVILYVALTSMTIGHLNHSNLNAGYGWLGYIISSPRFHLWHHDFTNHFKKGQNFAVIFSLWDRIFGTVYYPSKTHPKKLGFWGISKFPAKLLPRLFYPLGK